MINPPPIPRPSKLECIIFVVGITLLFFVVGFTVYIILDFAYGQDIDPTLVCLYHDYYPFNLICDKQQIDGIVSQLLERANEFNGLGLNESDGNIQDDPCYVGKYQHSVQIKNECTSLIKKYEDNGWYIVGEYAGHTLMSRK